MNRILTLLFCFLMVLGTTHAQEILQWNFNGTLDATTGEETVTTSDEVTEAIEFGTTASFGISPIDETSAEVAFFPGFAEFDGMWIRMPDVVNGVTVDGVEPFNLNDYTIIFDVLFPDESNGKTRPILDTTTNLEGPEYLVTSSNQIGVSNLAAAGTVPANSWHRLAWVANSSTATIQMFIDGELVGQYDINPILIPDGPASLTPGGTGRFFMSESGPSYGAYASSLQIRAESLSAPQIKELGGAEAEGIPTELPPVPSYLENFIPNKNVATDETEIGAIINPGTSEIDEDSISLKLNDEEVEFEVEDENGVLEIIADDFELAPGDNVKILVSYTDSINGEVSLEHFFDVAIYAENFEGVELGPNVDETSPGEEVWSEEGPDGWSVEDDVPVDEETGNNGVDEWAGWSFADYEWWVQVAGDQDRSRFNNAEGTVLVIDPDEWDDQPHGPGEMSTWMTSGEIDISDMPANQILLQFDSSWRPYSDMTGTVDVSFDGGEFQSVIRWESVPASPFFKGPDYPAPAGVININETVVRNIKNPEGASNLKLRFGLENAGNDWWWAVDNIFLKLGLEPVSIESHPEPLQIEEGESATFSVVTLGAEPFTYQWYEGRGSARTAIEGATASQFIIENVTPDNAGFYSVDVSNPVGTVSSSEAELKVNFKPEGKTLFFEDFESVELGPNVNEGLAGDEVWSKEGPEGWSIDDSGVPGAGDDALDGVTEWAGWSFANRDWWASTAGDQGRSNFKTGQGTVAISDGDEWDDAAHEAGELTSILQTPEIDVDGISANSMALSFSSAWRPYDQQKAIITAIFDGDTEVEVVRWESVSGSEFFKADDAQNENFVTLFNNPGGAKKMVLTFTYADAGNDWYWAIDNIKVTGQALPVFAEDFEGIQLGPNVDEGVAGDEVWSGAGPEGWVIDDSGVPGNGDPANDGVTEWAGWGFADKDWWINTAGDQGRSDFTIGQGTVAIADGDEWDDATRAPGDMTALMSTPEIDISDIDANLLVLNFDSSWNPYDDQKAIITVSYDGGEPIEVVRWESSDAGGRLKAKATDEAVRGIRLGNPEGAQTMQLTFSYADAGNDWYWAIDNIFITCEEIQVPPPVINSVSQDATFPVAGGQLSFVAEVEGATEYQWFFGATATGDRELIQGGNEANLSITNIQSNGAGFYVLRAINEAGWVESDPIEIRVVAASSFVTLLFEDFESMPLGPNIDEGVAGDEVVSVDPPAGWSLDDSGVPGNGDPANDGVTEWAGWGFADKDWWIETAGDQGRSTFTRGQGTVAIGDGDEWDDATHAPGEMTSLLTSPMIDLDGVVPNSMVLKFDSNFRPYDDMKAIITAQFDDSEPVEVVRWESQSSSPNFKPEIDLNRDEAFSVLIDNPEGAQTLVLTFTYADAGNDWYWAIDNIELTAEVDPFWIEDFEDIDLGPNVDEALAGDEVWSGEGPDGWSIDDSLVPGFDDPANDGVTEWAGWGFAKKEWWVETAEGQARGDFLKGQGTIAIADGDEWDDATHADGKMTAIMTSVPVSLEGVSANSAFLRFDSIWRPYADQKGIIEVSFDGGEPVEILRWESEDGPFFKADSAAHRNETVTVPVFNPEGAQNVAITFTYADAGNDWYWAIDNVQLLEGDHQFVPAPLPSLTPSVQENQITITFDGGILESAPSINGPWTPVDGATSPFTEDMNDASRFYRIVQ